MTRISDRDRKVLIFNFGLLLLGTFTWLRNTLALIGLLTSLFVLFSSRSSGGFLKLSVGEASPKQRSAEDQKVSHQKTGGLLMIPVDSQ